MKKTRQDTLFTIILSHNIKMDGGGEREEGRKTRSKRGERRRGDKRGREGKIKWKEIFAVVICLLKTVRRDLTANSTISPKML